jgi:hypothetical protein
VADNVRYNFEVNGTLTTPVHVPFTWGDQWPEHIVDTSTIQMIVASDILLYVK